MKLFDLSRDFLLGRFPLFGLVESQATVRQVAGSASALVCGGAQFATGVVELSEERGFGVV
jgi:hypothetical protein